MNRRRAISLYTLTLGLLLLTASAAHAQFRPRPIENHPATGERYHVEASTGFWFPTTDIVISSAGIGALSGLPGTMINANTDLGLVDGRFSERHLVVRPARRHKLRLQYIPIAYEQTAALSREIVFNGQRYVAGTLVNSTLDWKAWRIGYEYDFVSRDRGYGGVVMDVKYTDGRATLATAAGPREFNEQRVPIPALGGIFRVYPAANISVTGEVTGFALPEHLIENTQAHYIDIDFYGTVNFTNYVGVQVGYRSLDVGYVVSADNGAFKLRGLYFGVVARY